MKIGYARVITKYQTVALQVDALKKAGCTKVHTEVMSGSRSDRHRSTASADILAAIPPDAAPTTDDSPEQRLQEGRIVDLAGQPPRRLS